MNKTEYIKEYLAKASKAYYAGSPIISDEQYDTLEENVNMPDVGAASEKPVKHLFRMYSQQKYYNNEGKIPLCEYTKPKVATPKLDGAAISALYIGGKLVQVLTRGDGTAGQDITDKFSANPHSVLPNSIPNLDTIQVVGEIVAESTIPNSRNYASGALNLKDINEFNERKIYFIAYDAMPLNTTTYTETLNTVEKYGFSSILDTDLCSMFPHDGIVVRVNDNKDYQDFGWTAKHPRGSYALKERKVGMPTKLLDVVWQVGKSGKITPVAILEPVVIGEALVSRATLNNMGYITALELDIGDTVSVVRSGEIIPCIIENLTKKKDN